MRLPGSSVRAGTVHAVVLHPDSNGANSNGANSNDATSGEPFVLWRGADGRLRGAPRYCPHLDHDLAEGYVTGDELVCPGHAWAFDGDGHAYKRNEFGRVDPKGLVAVPDIDEANDIADVTLRCPVPSRVP